jgi:ferrous iron transport protein B
VGNLIRPLLPAGWIQSLILDGAWKGISSVLVFLPQILLLFLFIGILEDSGYLSRAALIADRVMRTTGLNGKAFIPLLSAYACAVPAIMATRTIENKRDRMATILVAPFMTCSARLPVYMLLIAAFIPNITYLHGFLGLQTLTMLGLYLAGFVAAMTTAWLLKSSILRSSETPFILELPQYRMPTLRSLGLRVLDRAKVFLRQAGTIILCVTLALWVLAHLPVIQAPGGQISAPELADSVIGRLGHFIEPAIAAPRLQLEDRHRPALQRAGPRGHGQHHGNFVWRRGRHSRPQPANRPAPRHDSRRRAGADDLLRLRHAVHLDHGRRPPRDQ